MAEFPAAFINCIAEEGTKDEAVEYLQQTWDGLCRLRNALIKMGWPLEQVNKMQEEGKAYVLCA